VHQIVSNAINNIYYTTDVDRDVYLLFMRKMGVDTSVQKTVPDRGGRSYEVYDSYERADVEDYKKVIHKSSRSARPLSRL
jgi:hypothetical protein